MMDERQLGPTPEAPVAQGERDSLDVINAAHKRQQGEAADGKIEQVRSGEEGAFPAADEPSTPQRTAAPAKARPLPMPASFGGPAAPAKQTARPERPVETQATAKPQSVKPQIVARPEIVANEAPTTRLQESAPAGAATPMITLDWVKQGEINVGQEGSCELMVRNTGSVSATDVVVAAYFPPTVQLTAVEPEPIEQGDHIAWRLDELPAGQQRSIQIRMIAHNSGDLAATANVRFTGSAS
jgi:hypothetical protein